MTEQEIIAWLQLQKPKLDAIIAKAGRDFLQKNRHRSNFGFDLAECQAESWNLRDGDDLCYDRPNTPFCYSLWYHARRVNTFLSHFTQAIISIKDLPSLYVFDLGAGTGAVQWAIGLIYHKLRTEGIRLPRVKIVNVDTSPFMLHYSKDYLWPHFLSEYSFCTEFANDLEYHVNSWSNESKSPISSPWITASYLFDISDTTNSTGEYKKSVLKGFQTIIDQYQPSKLLLLTAVSKQPLINEVTREFDNAQFLVERVRENSLVLNGRLPEVNKLRHELFDLYKSELKAFREQSINREAEWNDNSFIGTVITRRQVDIFSAAVPDQELKLHNEAIKIRKDVLLNDEQKKASRNIDSPSVIIGPAGCGKSIVITERVLNIVKQANYSPALTILVTTFNKELINQLSTWIQNLLDAGRYRVTHDVSTNSWLFYFTGSEIANIRLLHFDLLPKILGNVPMWRYVVEEEHKILINKIIAGVKLTNRITDDKYDSALNHEFLIEEYHRVIYGLQVGIQGAREDYLTVSRKGRGNKPQLQRNSEVRKLVWQCLEQYGTRIFNEQIPSFTLRRQLFLNRLVSGDVRIKYDYVIVDEFQDCTRADFEIFFSLLKDPNHLVISGDLAQAVHLGRSANIESLREAIRSGRTMNDISWSYLDGSYRLPLRVCEAIRKISEHIHLSFKQNHAVRVLTPYKGAPPGARPIVVMGKTDEAIAKSITEIINTYKTYNLTDSCILEKDSTLHYRTGVNTDSVLRLKGLEKQCVIWSTRAPIESSKEAFEFVYTILSRTACLLIIALFSDEAKGAINTQNSFKEAIGLLRTDRLIFWDRATKDAFQSFCVPILTDNSGEED